MLATAQIGEEARNFGTVGSKKARRNNKVADDYAGCYFSSSGQGLAASRRSSNSTEGQLTCTLPLDSIGTSGHDFRY